MTFGFEFTAPEISALLEPYRYGPRFDLFHAGDSFHSIADMPGSIDYVAFTNAVHARMLDMLDFITYKFLHNSGV